MKFSQKLSNAIHARAASYVYFVLSVCAFVFLRSAVWTYGWIAELYPLGDKFVPTLLGIIALCIAVTLIYLIISAFSDNGKEKCKGIIFLNIIHTVFSLLGIITFLYTSVLLFSMDSGITSAGFAKGFDALAPNLVYIALSFGLGLMFVFCSNTKKSVACSCFRIDCMLSYAFAGLYGAEIRIYSAEWCSCAYNNAVGKSCRGSSGCF